METLIRSILLAVVRAVVLAALAIAVGLTGLVISEADTSNASVGIANALTDLLGPHANAAVESRMVTRAHPH